MNSLSRYPRTAVRRCGCGTGAPGPRARPRRPLLRPCLLAAPQARDLPVGRICPGGPRLRCVPGFLLRGCPPCVLADPWDTQLPRLLAAASHRFPPAAMRYVCVGVGGVGGSAAARLALAGHEVVAVARGEHLSVTQSQGGLRLRTPAEDVIAPLTAVAHVGDMVPPLAPDDIVIVATKVHHVAAVLTEVAAASTAIGSGLGARRTVPSTTRWLMQK